MDGRGREEIGDKGREGRKGNEGTKSRKDAGGRGAEGWATVDITVRVDDSLFVFISSHFPL